MKVVLLAGGRGTRLAEETEVRPKPMVEIGGMPILWHILKIYSHHGFQDFVVALGYKGSLIKRFFLDFSTTTQDLRLDLATGKVEVTDPHLESWKLHLVDTGVQANTGGRIRALRKVIGDETFMVTYGDGVSDVDLQALLAFHRKQGRIATVTAVRPPARFGGLTLEGDLVSCFNEKPQTGEGWINGGFLVFEPAIFSYLEHESDSLEVAVLEQLAAEGQLAAYQHRGFWQCMDTLRDKELLERLWQEDAPWRIWGNS